MSRKADMELAILLQLAFVYACTSRRKPTTSSDQVIVAYHTEAACFPSCYGTSKTGFPADSNPGLRSTVQMWQFSEGRLPGTTVQLRSRDLFIRHLTGFFDGRSLQAARH